MKKKNKQRQWANFIQVIKRKEKHLSMYDCGPFPPDHSPLIVSSVVGCRPQFDLLLVLYVIRPSLVKPVRKQKKRSLVRILHSEYILHLCVNGRGGVFVCVSLTWALIKDRWWWGTRTTAPRPPQPEPWSGCIPRGNAQTAWWTHTSRQSSSGGTCGTGRRGNQLTG